MIGRGFHVGVNSGALDRAVKRTAGQALASFGSDVRRLREDAGMTRAALARAAGIDAGFLDAIESGTANPSVPSCARLAIALGADMPLRLYPTSGPTIRDRHQSAIAEVMLGIVHERWTSYAEIAVRRPARGWIDMGFHDPRGEVFVATEIQSELRRLEQILRWAEAKAAALPSWDGWTQLGTEPAISRLLIIRETRTNRAIADEHRRLLRAAYPADGRDALEALVGTGAWAGPAILWAARARNGGGRYRIVARP
jgi:transcriptional regulator with XRE-family HTH domain